MRKAFLETLCQAAESDSRIFLVTGDLGFSVLEPFMQRFPDRFLNVGVAEQNMIGVAAGLASGGKIVFAYSIANFPIFRCFEQIRNDVCYHQANVKIVAVGGGLSYGPLGYTHHAVEDLAVMRALPYMTVLAPADPTETRQVTQAIIRHPGPCYLRLGKANEPAIYAGDPAFVIGQPILIKDGQDLTMIAAGTILKNAMEAAERLETSGISARLLSLPTLKPIDERGTLKLILKNKPVVTLEEHSVLGGVGTAIGEILLAHGLASASFLKIGLPNEPCLIAGDQTYLREQFLLSAAQIFETVKLWIKDGGFHESD